MFLSSFFSANKIWRFFIALFFFAFFLGLGSFLSACNKKNDAPAEDPKIVSGRRIYRTNCTSCHSVDPAKDGSLGPAVKGSSLELITARITEAGYPPGYTPKRNTRIMARLPLSSEDIANVTAFLNSQP